MSRIIQTGYRPPASYPIPITFQQPYIYCPVCHVEYPQSQTQTHVLKHTMQTSKLNNKKQEQVAISTQHSKNTFIYPMVEPLEFSTDEITHINKRDTFKIDRKERNKKTPKVITMVDQQTQTWNRPLLQYRSGDTDLYNCFDRFFNGQRLSIDDLVGKNTIVASKRNLNEWQQQKVKK